MVAIIVTLILYKKRRCLMARKGKDSDREQKPKKDEGTHRKSNQGRSSGKKSGGGNRWICLFFCLSPLTEFQ